MFYPFNPYMFNNRVRTVDNFGIPVIRTIYVTSDVENSSVTYGICPKIWRQLPCEGIFLLNVTHVPSSTIPAGALVSIDPTRSSSSTTSSNTSSGAKPLINGSGDQMPTEEDNKEESKIDALQKEIDELKKVIKQASQMVPPPMKQMLPQDMQDVMDKVDQ